MRVQIPWARHSLSWHNLPSRAVVSIKDREVTTMQALQEVWDINVVVILIATLVEITVSDCQLGWFCTLHILEMFRKAKGFNIKFLDCVGVGVNGNFIAEKAVV